MKNLFLECRVKYLVVLMFLGILNVISNEKPHPKWITNNIFHDDVIIKNEGQFSDIAKQKILYKDLRDNIYFTSNGFIFEVNEIVKEKENIFSKEEETKIKSYYYAYEFIGCNSNVRTELQEMQEVGYYTFQNSQQKF
jgi:hypothetical protein